MAITKTILLVEDDPNLADGLILNLEAEGYEVVHVSDGNLVLGEFKRGNFDLLLLDIMLPGMDGITICKRLRTQGAIVPILFISARDQSHEKIEGLLAGGDDYISKPLASGEELDEIFNFDDRYVNFKTYEASGPGGKVSLTRRECMVIKYLVERAGEVVSRDQLLDAVWGYHTYPTNRTIDNFILKLRKIFEDDPKNPAYIETIRGVGYRFASSNPKSDATD
jgi:two-component system alkaline phosphatase synthesis response regulator PhoP